MSEENDNRVVITSAVLQRFGACYGKQSRFARLFPDGLDISGLWGEEAERRATWAALLSNEFVRENLAWALWNGLVPSRLPLVATGQEWTTLALATCTLFPSRLWQMKIENMEMHGVRAMPLVIDDSKIGAMRVYGCDLSLLSKESQIRTLDINDSVLAIPSLVRTEVRMFIVKDSRIINASLEKVRFNAFAATNSTFVGAAFIECNGIWRFVACPMHKVVFTRCDMSGAIFTRCDLSDATFSQCDLRRATFSLCDLRGTRFEQCQMDESTYFEQCMTDEDTVFGYNQTEEGGAS